MNSWKQVFSESFCNFLLFLVSLSQFTKRLSLLPHFVHFRVPFEKQSLRVINEKD